MGLFQRAKNADANYSLASWVPTTAQFLFPTAWAALVGLAASYRDWIWNDYGMLGILLIGLGAAAIASLAFALVGIGFRAWRGSPPPTQEIESQPTRSPTLEWDKPLEKRFRVHFKNETVLIDGFEFVECKFENVTFKYQGTRPFRFTGKNTGNSRKVTTDDKVVGQTLTLPMIFRPDLAIEYEVSKTGSRPSYELTDAGNIFYPPTVTQTPPTLAKELYVGEIRFTFDGLKTDRHTEIAMRVFNGTGRNVELVGIAGLIKFNAPNNTDSQRMGELPTPAARPDMKHSAHPLEEWLLILTQRVPAAEADKIVEMIDQNIPIHFDLSNLKIDVRAGNESGVVPLWSGVSYRSNFGFGRIIDATANITLGSKFAAE